MVRRVLFLSVLFSMVFCGSSFSMSFDPIPDKTDVVLAVSNHSNLPLGDVLNKIPIPAPAKQKIDDFIKETAFNPLKDVSRVQIMVKKAEQEKDDDQVIVLSGKFDKEKIVAFLKKINIFDVDKNGDQEIFKGKDGKGALCIFDNEKIAIGKFGLFNPFLEARNGKGLSTHFDGLKAQVEENAYACVLIGNADFLKREMEKNSKKREEKMGNNPGKKWLNNYLFEGLTPQGIFIQLLESKLEAKFIYDRSSDKNNSIHAQVKINDPKVTISKVFEEVLKNFPLK